MYLSQKMDSYQSLSFLKNIHLNLIKHRKIRDLFMGLNEYTVGHLLFRSAGTIQFIYIWIDTK